MNTLLNWLDKKQNSLVLLYCVFTLSAWWILKNQIAFAYPLSKVTSVTDLTILSSLKEVTVLTRWAAVYLDHGIRLQDFFLAIHTEDWVFLILGILFCFPVEKRRIAIVVRIVMVIEILMNLALGFTIISALNATDTLFILNSIKLIASFELIVSILLMIALFAYLLRLCFHEYSD